MLDVGETRVNSLAHQLVLKSSKTCDPVLCFPIKEDFSYPIIVAVTLPTPILWIVKRIIRLPDFTHRRMCIWQNRVRGMSKVNYLLEMRCGSETTSCIISLSLVTVQFRLSGSQEFKIVVSVSVILKTHS